MTAPNDLIKWLIAHGGADDCSVCVYNHDGKCHARKDGVESCRRGMLQYFRVKNGGGRSAKEWSDEYREYQKNYHSRIREERKAAGLCVYCGKRPVVAGGTLCEEHKRKRDEYAHEYYMREKKRREEGQKNER